MVAVSRSIGPATTPHYTVGSIHSFKRVMFETRFTSLTLTARLTMRPALLKASYGPQELFVLQSLRILPRQESWLLMLVSLTVSSVWLSTDRWHLTNSWNICFRASKLICSYREKAALRITSTSALSRISTSHSQVLKLKSRWYQRSIFSAKRPNAYNPFYQQKLTALDALKKSILHQAFTGAL